MDSAGEQMRKDESGQRARPVRIFLMPRAASNQKRASQRTAVAGDIEVTTDADAEPTRIESTLVDVSRTGLRFSSCDARCNQLAENEQLIVRISTDFEVPAVVRWTKKDKRKHVVGAEWTSRLSYEDVWRIRTLTNIDL